MVQQSTSKELSDTTEAKIWLWAYGSKIPGTVPKNPTGDPKPFGSDVRYRSRSTRKPASLLLPGAEWIIGALPEERILFLLFFLTEKENLHIKGVHLDSFGSQLGLFLFLMNLFCIAALGIRFLHLVGLLLIRPLGLVPL